MSFPSTGRQTQTARATVLLGIVLLACNLRVAVTSIGPVLGDITADLRFTPTAAGILTSLPVIAFSAFGAMAPRICAALGLHRATLAAVLVSATALACRPLATEAVVFFALTALALAGIAVANVVMPSLVKTHFPENIALVTAVYTTALALGLTLATSVTVPVAEALGSWRWGLATWALTMAATIVPWALLARRDTTNDETRARNPHISLRDVAKTRVGWLLATAFALQSAIAYSVFGWFPHVYQDVGFSPAVAGFLVGAITAVGIPVSFVIPWLADRLRGYGVLACVLVFCYVVGFLGLAVAPTSGAWLWAVAIGTGQATFPMILTLIALRARTSAGTAALSGFAQPVGYLLASPAPILIGMLYGATGVWTVPLIVMMALALLLLVFCVMASRPAWVEDDVPDAVTRAEAPRRADLSTNPANQ